MKFTNKQMYAAIVSRLSGGPFTHELQPTNEELIQFCMNRIDILNKESEKAKEKRITTEDGMLEAIYLSVRSDDYKSIDDIIRDICQEYPDVTAAKVVGRLTKLNASGRIEKMPGFIMDSEGKKRKITLYKAIV